MTETAPQSAKVVKRNSVPDIVRDFSLYVQAIPEADDEDAGMQIVGRILDASSPDQLNALGELPSGEDVAGRTLVVHGLQRRPSSFDSGLGVYLVIDAADADTGESVRFGCGSTTVVAVLAKAHHEGWLPITVRITVADKATKAGFRPLNIAVFPAFGS